MTKKQALTIVNKKMEQIYNKNYVLEGLYSYDNNYIRASLTRIKDNSMYELIINVNDDISFIETE
jgi:hypothetical protein